MNVGRSWLVFFVILIIACSIVLIAAEKPILRSWNALSGKSDGCDWQCVGAGGGSTASAAGWQNGKLVICWFNMDGTKLSMQRISLPDDRTGGTICRLQPVRDGMAYIGLYGANAEKLYLYRILGDKADCLLAEDCVGSSCQERIARTRLTELTFENSVMSFALWKDSSLECYICRENGGIESKGKGTTEDDGVLSVISLEDGSLLQGGVGSLTLNNKAASAPLSGQMVTDLTRGKGGWYYIDAVGFEVCFVDADLDEMIRILPLSTEVNGKTRVLTSAAITREENVLMLFDGTTLCISDDAGTIELEGVLRQGLWGQILSLAKWAGIALAGALALWLLLCVPKKGYASLIVLRGSLVVAAALLCYTALRFAVLKPETEKAASRGNAEVISSVLQATNADRRMGEEKLASEVALMLEGTGRGGNVSVVSAEISEDTWRLSDGRNAVMLESFSSELSNEALINGTAYQFGNGEFRYVFAQGERSLSIRIDVPDPDVDLMVNILVLGGFGLLTLISLLILITVSIDVRRISKSMERISQGIIPKQLKMRTGDELESMASIVNSLGAAMKTQEEIRDSKEQAYRRFVPEKILSIFGKPSITDVDKTDFAARRMALISVRFGFPDNLYTDINNSRLLFDSVNEVIGRISAIVARKNGTTFHIAYNGFDFVMEDSGEAVSTAVAIQQEILSFNESRAQESLPGVKLGIAIDRGNFMIGIVGDASMMAPTTISTSLSVVHELINLCYKLKAGILCTEVIISSRKDYGSRYMGKCVVGGQPVRVYEVFDGDDFNTRRGKTGSTEEFSEGIYALYGGDASGAKHTFLKLAHSYPLDGGARYYLHLADMIEHDPSTPCVLNYDHSDSDGGKA